MCVEWHHSVCCAAFMSLLPLNVYYWENGTCEAPLGGLFNLWILTCVPPARGHPWALSTGYICKTLDAKNSLDAVVHKEGNLGLWGCQARGDKSGLCAPLFTEQFLFSCNTGVCFVFLFFSCSNFYVFEDIKYVKQNKWQRQSGMLDCCH